MKEFIEQLPSTEKPAFKELTMRMCQWSDDQYYDRYNGRVKLTGSERYVCELATKKLLKRAKNEIRL